MRSTRTFDAVCGAPVALATWALWAALATGYLGLHGWVFDLFANFRVQYMALFALCAVVLMFARRRKTALVALAGVAFTTVTMAPYFQTRPALAQSSASFRLLTFNVWHRNQEIERAIAFLKSSDADVLILQEVTPAQVEALARRLSQYPHHTVTSGSRHGLAVFSRWPLRAEHLLSSAGATRITRTTIDWQGRPFTMFGVHLSWPLGRVEAAARTVQLDALAKAVRNEAGPVLLAGDFNLTPWSRHYERFVANSGLADCALGHGLMPTWPSQALPVRIRIDLCFASAHWRVRDMVAGPKLGSDHLPVIVDLELSR